MATRFFYLPWRSQLDLGNSGRPRWVSGWQDYNWPGNDIKASGGYYKFYNPYSSGGMPQYAITTNANLVPLTETGLPVLISYGDPWPHYYPSSYSGSSVAYVTQGRAQDYVDAIDPVAKFYWVRPFANFVYKLRGSGSMARTQFAYNVTDSGNGSYPGTAYTKLRLDAWDTYLETVYKHRVLRGTIGPAACYIYRPGTGVVAVVFTDSGSLSGYTPGYYFSPSMQRDYVNTAGATHYYYGHLFNYGRIYASTFAWQDGDLLVWEMWAVSDGINNFDDFTTASKTIAFMTGGGESGQPFSVDGNGKPRWAPAWQSVGTITGYEPGKPRVPDLSVGC